MSKKIFLPALLTLSVFGAAAQVDFNTPAGIGFFRRGSAMLGKELCIGAVDQLTEADRLSLPVPENQTAAFRKAVAMIKSNNPGAMSAVDAFLRDYPASVLCHYARLLKAEMLYDDGRWMQALEIFRELDADTFDPAVAAVLRYHQGFCCLMADDLAAAEANFVPLLSSKKFFDGAKFFMGYIAYRKKNYSEAKKLFSEVNQTKAPSSMAPFYLAQIYYERKEYSAALREAEKALSIPGIPESFSAEAERVAGESEFNLGHTAKAVKYLENYCRAVDEPLPSALYILGISRYDEADYAGAVKALVPVSSEDNVIGQSANLYIGQAYAKENNYSAALLAFDNACRMNFNDGVREQALYNYAVANAEGGRIPFGNSVASFETFLREYPNSKFAPAVEEYIIAGYMTDNNYIGALNSINSISNPSQNLLKAKQQVLYTLGTKELAQDDAIGALNRFRQAKALGNLNPEIYRELDLWIAEALYKRQAYKNAAVSYRDYIRGAGKSAPNIPQANYGLGYALFGEKDFGGAYSAFEAFISSPGGSGATMKADALNRMADARYFSAEFDRAAALYDRAFDQDPASGDYALFQKAMMKGLRRQHTQKIEGMTDMMKQFPSSALVPQALLELADSYNELGNTTKVIETYSSLVSRYPATAQGRQGELLLAIAYLDGGDSDRAIASYKHIISAYPSSDEAKVAAEDLKRISADRGMVAEYVAFMNSVPNAPKLNPSEIDRLTFASAELAYEKKNEISAIRKYLADYPSGDHRASALLYAAEYDMAKDNPDLALKEANQLLNDYPHSSVADDALLIKAEAETALDMLPAALESYRKLEASASSPVTVNKARLGIMKAARDLGDGSSALDAADKLLASSALQGGARPEILFSRGVALEMTGDRDGAIAQWSELTDNADDLYGAKASFYLANLYFSDGNLDDAEKQAEKLIDANTPHNYWLARTFILLSDVKRSRGETFEAEEYLRTLRRNYPGNEADIFTMIDQRLDSK